MLTNLKNLLKKSALAVIAILGAIMAGILIFSYYLEKEPKRSVYRIAIDETWYPLQLYNREPYITAFSIEALQAIAAKQQFAIDLVPTTSDNLLNGLARGNYEGALSPFIPRAGDTERYLSSNPYYLLGPVLIVSQSSDIKYLDGLKGKTVGLINKSGTIFSLKNRSSINFIFYDYHDRFKLIEDVRNHVIDGMVLNMIGLTQI